MARTILGNGTLATLGLVGVFAAVGAMRKRGSVGLAAGAARQGSGNDQDVRVNDGEDEISGIFQGEPVGDILIYPSAKSLNAVIRDELGMHILNLPPGRWGYIGGIELPEDARGRGIGERMMRQMLVYAAQRGLRGIVLFSEFRPSSFWEKMGFVDILSDGDVSSGLRYRGDPWPTIPMSRWLEKT